MCMHGDPHEISALSLNVMRMLLGTAWQPNTFPIFHNPDYSMQGTVRQPTMETLVLPHLLKSAPLPFQHV